MTRRGLRNQIDLEHYDGSRWKIVKNYDGQYFISKYFRSKPSTKFKPVLQRQLLESFGLTEQQLQKLFDDNNEDQY